ncbi:MAG TPA: hypothetical protein VFV38_30335 [Ktedonobacteraceae bacterium]|nr:hypothetical protein [Ktedonobacteraceae bacterium]
MSDTITQTRLSMRLDMYMSNYEEMKRKKETFSSEKWDAAWKAAEVARVQNNLTPELVDDVRMALNNST